MQFLAQLIGILNNAFMLYSFGMALWAALLWSRNQPLSGNFFGAMWLAVGLAGVGLVVELLHALTGGYLRPVGWLYQLYFIIVYPGTFALLRGRDDRNAALTFAGVAAFTAFATASANDPSRHFVTPETIQTVVLSIMNMQ